MQTTLVLLTILIPWLGAFLVWIAGWHRFSRPQTPRLQNTLAVIFSGLAGVCALALLPLASNQSLLGIPAGAYFGEISFVADGLSVPLAIIATVIGCLAVIFSIDYMRGDPNLGRYYFFVLLFIGAMAGLVFSGSILFLFFFWEITALCSYGLISFYNDDPKAVRGGIKALIITSLGGIGLFIGGLIVYSYLGTYEIKIILSMMGNLPKEIVAVLAFGFIAAAAAKSAQFPFHTWLPDAMEAPTPVSALIHAATMVNAGVYLLARFFPAFADVAYWKETVTWVGVISVLIAGLMASVALDLKRVLAYSTISQLGYMIYAIGAGGVFPSQFHLFNHAIFKALLFLSAGAIIHTIGTRDLRLMGKRIVTMPFVRAVFIIGGLALAGIPFLNGFWSKELILELGFSQTSRLAYALALLSAGITAYYTLRVIWKVFYAEEKTAENNVEVHGHAHDAPIAMRVALIPLAFGALVSWLLAGPLNELMITTLPESGITEMSTGEMIVEIMTAPLTYVALSVIALGLAAWLLRNRLKPVARSLQPIYSAASAEFGFEKVNDWVISAVQGISKALQPLQTGELNWNLLGVISGILILMVWLVWMAG